jgi:pSer/pThr/pTyr-binding forkhead associated (FHA) protein
MAKLIIKVPGAPASEVALKPGANRFGRSLNTDFPIPHPSVSGAHCEIVDTDGALGVRDLGSTNGTLLDGVAVQESPFQPGQTLRLGEVEIVHAPADAPRPAARPAPRPAARVTQAGAAAPAIWRTAPPARVAAPTRNFYKSIPGAFVFPFRRNGLILLVSGTLFFVVLGYMSGLAGIFGIMLGVFLLGYLFAFMQTIITTTATGDEEMPGWPDFDGWSSVLEPFFQLLAILVVCLGPAFFYSRYVSDDQTWLAATLWILGLVALPMALLAVTMYDTVAALNPLLIVLSIVKVPLEYAATCLVLALLVVLLSLATHQVRELVRVLLLPTIVSQFFSLYIFTVMMRLLGLLFYAKKDRLGWKIGGK